MINNNNNQIFSKRVSYSIAIILWVAVAVALPYDWMFEKSFTAVDGLSSCERLGLQQVKLFSKNAYLVQYGTQQQLLEVGKEIEQNLAETPKKALKYGCEKYDETSLFSPEFVKEATWITENYGKSDGEGKVLLR